MVPTTIAPTCCKLTRSAGTKGNRILQAVNETGRLRVNGFAHRFSFVNDGYSRCVIRLPFVAV